MFSFGLQGINPDIIPHLAVGTSLATIVFTSVSSIRSHNKHGAVRWDLFRPMTVGIVAGALVGAWTASLLSGRALELVIGIFVILVGLKMFFQVDPKPGRDVPGVAGLGVAGGGNVRMQQAVGTSAACGLPIAIAGALGNIWTGWSNPALPELSAGFIYLPALIGIILTSVFFARVGANLAHRLNARILKRTFSIMLLLVGLRFLLS